MDVHIDIDVLDDACMKCTVDVDQKRIADVALDVERSLDLAAAMIERAFLGGRRGHFVNFVGLGVVCLPSDVDIEAPKTKSALAALCIHLKELADEAKNTTSGSQA